MKPSGWHCSRPQQWGFSTLGSKLLRPKTWIIHVATPKSHPTRLANPNRNPGDACLIHSFYILLSFLFQKCRDPNLRLDPKDGSEPEPGLLRRFHLSYQNIYLCHFVIRFQLRGSIFKWEAHKHLHFTKCNYNEGILCLYKMIYKTKH